jgi:hypothetical protein
LTSKIALGSFALLALLIVGLPLVSAAPNNPVQILPNQSLNWNPNTVLQGGSTIGTVADYACSAPGIWAGSLVVTNPNGVSWTYSIQSQGCGIPVSVTYPPAINSAIGQVVGTYTAVFSGTDGRNSWTLQDNFVVVSNSCMPGQTVTVTVTASPTTSTTFTQTVTTTKTVTVATSTQTEIVTSIQAPQNASYELLIYIPGSTYNPGSVTVTANYPPSTQIVPFFSFGGQQAFVVYGMGAPDQHSVTLSWDSSSYTLALPTSYEAPAGGVPIAGSGWSGFEWTSFP